MVDKVESVQIRTRNQNSETSHHPSKTKTNFPAILQLRQKASFPKYNLPRQQTPISRSRERRGATPDFSQSSSPNRMTSSRGCSPTETAIGRERGRWGGGEGRDFIDF